jgi:hypothetical protein
VKEDFLRTTAFSPTPGDRMVTDFTAAIHSCVAVARVVSAGLNKTSHHLLRSTSIDT